VHFFRTETSRTYQDLFTYFCIDKATSIVKFSVVILDMCCQVTMQSSLYTLVKFYKSNSDRASDNPANLVVVCILLKTSPSSSCLHSFRMLSIWSVEKTLICFQIFWGKGILEEAHMDMGCLDFHHSVRNFYAHFAYLLPHERSTFFIQTRASKRT